MQVMHDPKIYRILDANYNRLKEGLRVCEDICRFILDQEDYTRDYKNLRHRLTDELKKLNYGELIESRAVESDIGQQSNATELARADAKSIYFANAQRIKESFRVLEEFLKLIDGNSAQQLKSMRYESYELEKKVAQCF